MIDPDLVETLRRDGPAVWLRPADAARPVRAPIDGAAVADAAARLRRFRPALAALFPDRGWDGRVASALEPHRLDGLPPLLVKRDDALPMTGSVKARGGVYELLTVVERAALTAGVLREEDDYRRLLEPAARAALAGTRVVVASTGNLGFSIGLVARAFGVPVQVHMSHDAKAWKKDRLRRLGAEVVEHPCDFHGAVEHARAAAAATGAHFIDDERSETLFTGYAIAAGELADQLAAMDVHPTPERPLVLYLPCGVGGAPGGVTAGAKAHWGEEAVVAVFVEPTASPCVLAALANGGEAVSVYDLGLSNDTVADGLAVPLASELVLARVGRSIDAAVAVSDAEMLHWVGRCWREAGLRLEPSAASGFAAVRPFLGAWRGQPLDGAHHLVWTTGGSMLPDDEFERYLKNSASM